MCSVWNLAVRGRGRAVERRRTRGNHGHGRGDQVQRYDRGEKRVMAERCIYCHLLGDYVLKGWRQVNPASRFLFLEVSLPIFVERELKAVAFNQAMNRIIDPKIRSPAH